MRRQAMAGYARPLVVAALMVLSAGCGKIAEDLWKSPDISPVKRVLTNAMPVAYAANVAMAAMQGAVLPNVHIVRTGDTSIGCFLLEIDVDSRFPLPAGLRADGKIVVAGFVARNNVAMMTALFTSMNVREGVFTIRDISTFPVVKEVDPVTGDTGLIVVYAGIDVNAGSDTLMTIRMNRQQVDAEFNRYENMNSFDSTVALKEDAWIIRIDNHATVIDPSDDRYTISGGGQYVETGVANASVCQFTMIGMLMTTACRRNPLDGWALIQDLGSSGSGVELGHVLLTAESACNGTIKVAAATGSYTPSWGKSIPLDLGN